MENSKQENKKPQPCKWPSLLLSFLIAGTLTIYFLEQGTMPRQAAFMAGIFLLSALLWTTEALPLFATALLILGLEIILLTNPGGWTGLGFSSGEQPTFQKVFQWAANPVLLLFFGGFLLARAAIKTGLDQAMSAHLMKLFGSRPRSILLGVMGITALFSLWMSNTATTAMMIALVAPLISQIPPGDRFRKAMVLAIPFAANIGGLGTPISSPPNAVALGFLRNAGLPIDFLEWMLVAIPLMVGMLLFAWLLLGIFYRPSHQNLKIQLPNKHIDGTGWFVVGIFSITVLLWLTDKWHGLPASIVALLPVIAFTGSGVLNRDDLNHVDWSALILIGGGIALGSGILETGLDQVIVAWLPIKGESILLLATVLVVTTMIFSTFMSNTAAANLLLPIGISSTLAMAGDNVTRIAVSIALAASLAMVLPISTPPNAIAYSEGEFSKKEMAILGSIIGIVGGILIILLCGVVLRIWKI